MEGKLPKLRNTVLGVPETRIISWGFTLGSPIVGNYHILPPKKTVGLPRADMNIDMFCYIYVAASTAQLLLAPTLACCSSCLSDDDYLEGQGDLKKAGTANNGDN